MRLLRIARHNWDVLAVCDERGDCPVLDFLDDLGGTYRASVTGMLNLLRDYVPVHGPQRMREPLCKPLGDDIFEFRKEPKGKRLRVAWFYDTGRVVVCTVAFTKAEKSPPEEKARSLRMRALYFEGQRNQTNRIVDIGAG